MLVLGIRCCSSKRHYCHCDHPRNLPRDLICSQEKINNKIAQIFSLFANATMHCYTINKVILTVFINLNQSLLSVKKRNQSYATSIWKEVLPSFRLSPLRKVFPNACFTTVYPTYATPAKMAPQKAILFRVRSEAELDIVRCQNLSLFKLNLSANSIHLPYLEIQE